VVKSLLHGTFSIKLVSSLVVKWEAPILVILTPCHNANITFQDLKKAALISHKSNQNVLRNANLVMLLLGEMMNTKLLVVLMALAILTSRKNSLNMVQLLELSLFMKISLLIRAVFIHTKLEKLSEDTLSKSSDTVMKTVLTIS